MASDSEPIKFFGAPSRPPEVTNQSKNHQHRYLVYDKLQSWIDG